MESSGCALRLFRLPGIRGDVEVFRLEAAVKPALAGGEFQDAVVRVRDAAGIVHGVPVPPDHFLHLPLRRVRILAEHFSRMETKFPIREQKAAADYPAAASEMCIRDRRLP